MRFSAMTETNVQKTNQTVCWHCQPNTITNEVGGKC